MEVVPYGDSPDQFYRLYSPAHTNLSNSKGLLPVVVIIHGGYWKQQYGLDSALISTLPPFFVEEGYYTAHIEYRRGNKELDGGEGGWPQTNEDVLSMLTSLSLLANREKIDLDRVVLLGHSAGGTLALWPCCEHTKMRTLPFAPRLCVAIAPIGDLEYAFLRKLSDKGDAVQKYLGVCPEYDPTSGKLSESSPYLLASPKELLPLKTPCLIVMGSKDDVVPPDCVEGFFEAAQQLQRSQVQLELLQVDGADHFDLVNAESQAWKNIFPALQAMLHNQ
eukprot:gene9054-9992_t